MMLKERFTSEYINLIELFRNELLNNGIQPIAYQGMPEPHLPIVGKKYYNAKYQIAFYGMETNYWGSLTDFLDIALKDVEKAVFFEQSAIDDQECLKWINNFHTSFWDFVFQFLATFYHVPLKNIMDGMCPEIIQSIIWGNTNSIERYCVSAEKEGVSAEVYEKVKKASKIFDGASHIISSVNPRVIIVLNWSEAEEWLVSFAKRTNVLKLELNNHFTYYYLRNSNTHIFWTAHPRWLSMNIGFQEQIELIISKFKEFNIWHELPEEQYVSLPTSENYTLNKSSIEYKREFISKLSAFLAENNLVLSGATLARILGENGITSQYGEQYVIGGRGIFNVIRRVWHYYHDELKDGSTSYNIARAFTKENGEYAY